MNLTERVGELHQLKNEIDELERKLSDLKKKEEVMQWETIEYMKDTGVATHKTTNGLSVTLNSPSFHASVKKDMKDDAMQWLVTNGYEYSVLPNVHSRTLSRIIKERAEAGDHIPSDLFSFFIKDTLSLRK